MIPSAEKLHLEPIPTPLEFPIEWENPEDAQLFWFRENVHFPDPVKPLDFIFCVKGIEWGYSQATHHYGIPGETHDRVFNTYVYEAVEPPQEASEQIEIQLKQAQENLERVIPRLDDLWQNQWLPEIKQHLAWWESYDLKGASLADLITHLKESQTNFYRIWEIHFSLLFPMILAISLFEELYRELFPESSPLAAYDLLAGFPNKTIESDLALWNLSRQIFTSPDVSQIFKDHPLPNILQKLKDFDSGQAFLTQLEKFLQEYGRRGDRWSVLAPPWIEDPTPVLKTLQEYVANPTRNLEEEMQAKVTAREVSVSEARAQLEGYPQPLISEFETRLEAAQIGQALKEEHSFWIDFLGIYQVRCVCVALGRKLAESGLVKHSDDVYYLTVEELTAINTPAQPDYQGLVDERRSVEAHFATITPPLALGSSGPEMDVDDPISRAIVKVMGGPSPDEVTTTSSAMAGPKVTELRGTPGSSGVVQGFVKVLHAIDEAETLTKGDILVAGMTTPSWSPLFAMAAGLVTDGGGVLSHAAIVAREYGIPAVVNTGSATSILQDGQRIEVDGNLGIIRLLES